MFIKKLHDENEKVRGSTTRLKLHDEDLQNLRLKVDIWETIERKWTKTLFLHKKQQEALVSQVKVITKEKEIALIDLKL